MVIRNRPYQTDFGLQLAVGAAHCQIQPEHPPSGGQLLAYFHGLFCAVRTRGAGQSSEVLLALGHTVVAVEPDPSLCAQVGRATCSASDTAFSRRKKEKSSRVFMFLSYANYHLFFFLHLLQCLDFDILKGVSLAGCSLALPCTTPQPGTHGQPRASALQSTAVSANARAAITRTRTRSAATPWLVRASRSVQIRRRLARHLRAGRLRLEERAVWHDDELEYATLYVNEEVGQTPIDHTANRAGSQYRHDC